MDRSSSSPSVLCTLCGDFVDVPDEEACLSDLAPTFCKAIQLAGNRGNADSLSSPGLAARLSSAPVCSPCKAKVASIKEIVAALENLQRCVDQFKTDVRDGLKKVIKLRAEKEGAISREIQRLQGEIAIVLRSDSDEIDDGESAEPCDVPEQSEDQELQEHHEVDADEDSFVPQGESEEEEELEPVRKKRKAGGSSRSKKSAKSKSTAKKLYSCQSCEASYPTEYELRDHCKSEHSRQAYICTIKDCRRQFARLNLFKKHEAIHEEGVDLLKRHSCEVCGKLYETKNSLERHSAVHSGDWKFKCDKCPKGFHRPSALKEHQAKEHDGECPYPCQFCEERFPTALKRRFHTSSAHPENIGKEDSTACDLCGKVFSGKDALKCHQRQIHKDFVSEDAPLPFKCSVCEKDFVKKSWLERHLLQHSEERRFQCDLCDQSFRFPNSLRTHKLRHTGKPGFQCKFCGKGFFLKNRCTIHERTHDKESKPCICQYCGKTFGLSGYLTTHLQRMHYEELGLPSKPKFFNRSVKQRAQGKEPKSAAAKKHESEPEAGTSVQALGMQVVYEGNILEEVVVENEPMIYTLTIL